MRNTSIIFILLILLCQVFVSSGQHYYLPLNNDVQNRYEPLLNKPGSSFHTSIKPFISNEIDREVKLDSLDSTLVNPDAYGRTYAARKIFKEHLFELNEEDFSIYGDLNIEFAGGKSMEDTEDQNIFTNSRGIAVGGTFGERFSFASAFFESQSTFPGYVDSAIRETFVVPGGSRIKNFGNNIDYGTASGSIAYSLKKYFSFQLGYDRNFIGDGYRSMILSDNSYNYPFLKVNANFWKIKYMVLYALFQDGPYVTAEDDVFKRKYGTFHVFDINIGKHVTLGVTEALIWRHNASRGYDLNYINPVIFLRPVEFSVGSPDNALLGFTGKVKLNRSVYFYGQVMLDEFKIREVRSGDGWWGNKQAFQTGFRYFNLLGIKNLSIGSEFNYARPFTYQHRSTLTAYAHYNQALAHPLGANFWESVSTVTYAWKRFHGEARVILAKIGYDIDSTGAQANYGNNVLTSYETLVSEYGNKTLQGLETQQFILNFRVWYLMNPKSNMIVEAGTRLRTTENIRGTSETLMFYFGIRTTLTNRYFDF